MEKTYQIVLPVNPVIMSCLSREDQENWVRLQIESRKIHKTPGEDITDITENCITIMKNAYTQYQERVNDPEQVFNDIKRCNSYFSFEDLESFFNDYEYEYEDDDKTDDDEIVNANYWKRDYKSIVGILTSINNPLISYYKKLTNDTSEGTPETIQKIITEKADELNTELEKSISERQKLPEKDEPPPTPLNYGILVPTHTYLNTYVANNLPKISMTDENGDYLSPIMTVNAGGNVEYQMFISADENTPIWAKSLTPFDVAMLFCVCSLWENSIDVFYDDMLYYQWTDGNRLKKDSNKDGGTRGLINDSITKLSKIALKYDYTAEVKRKNPNFRGKVIVDGHLLELQPATIFTGGHIVKGFRILTEPPILTHAKSVGQFITINRDLFTICDVLYKEVWNDSKAENEIKKELLTSEIEMTPDRLLVRDYLIRRIYIYKSSKRRKTKKKLPFNKILFDTMFDELKIINPTQKTRLKPFITACFDFWELKGLIKGYTAEKAPGRKGIAAITFKV